MSFWIIATIVLALYFRTTTYNYVIDDYVRREGYLYEVPTEGVPPHFFLGKPSIFYRLFMIGMHVVNSLVIYLLWGWQASLLFAVHPMGVWGTAWVTGNYYATTAYFTLISYYFLVTFNPWIGVPIALLFYTCALNSTVCAMTYPFFLLLCGNPIGALFLAPLYIFITGKKFSTGIKIREKINIGKQVSRTDFPINRLVLMTKVMARYVYYSFVPMKLYYFGSWCERIRDSKEEYDRMHSCDEEFWASLLVCLSVFGAGLLIHPVGTLWFFAIMAIHSQFNIVGQPFAQRYLYLPMVGLCVVVGSALTNYPLVLLGIAGWLACKTFFAIPQWKDQDAILRNEVAMNPHRANGYNMVGQYMMAKTSLGKQTRWQVNETSMYIRRSMEMEPENWVIRMNYAAFLVTIGRLQEGLKETQETLRILKEKATLNEQPNIKLVEEQIVKIKNVIVDMEKNHKKITKDEKRKADLEKRKMKGKKK